MNRDISSPPPDFMTLGEAAAKVVEDLRRKIAERTEQPSK